MSYDVFDPSDKGFAIIVKMLVESYEKLLVTYLINSQFYETALPKMRMRC